MSGRIWNAGRWDDRSLEPERDRNSLVYAVSQNDSCRLGSSRMLFVFLYINPSSPIARQTSNSDPNIPLVPPPLLCASSFMLSVLLQSRSINKT